MPDSIYRRHPWVSPWHSQPSIRTPLVLIPLDAQVTAIVLANPSVPIQVAQSSPSNDSDSRWAKLSQ